MTKYYLVDTVSTHRFNYIVSAEGEISNAAVQEQLETGNLKELHQEFLGEHIVGIREVTKNDLDKIEVVVHGEDLFDSGDGFVREGIE